MLLSINAGGTFGLQQSKHDVGIPDYLWIVCSIQHVNTDCQNNLSTTISLLFTQ